MAAREGWHELLAALGYLGAFMTAVYTWRMIFRAFYGEPGRAGAPSSSTATSTTRRSTPTRPRARRRTPTSASPAPSTTSPSARVDEGRHGPAGRARHRRRRRPDPRRDELRCTTSSSRPSRAPRYYETLEPVRRAHLPAAWSAARLIGLAGIALAYRLWVAEPASAPPPSASASPGLHTLLRAQVVLRRAHRPADRAADGLVRALRPQRVRARGRQRRCSSAARRAPCAPGRPPCAPRSPASCATTPRCSRSACRRSASTS